MEMSGVVASMRERFYHASREWHRFLGLDPDQLKVKVGAKRKTEEAIPDSTGPSATIVRGKRLRRGKLKEMLGAEAEFRGYQKDAIQCIIWGENFIVQVMGASGPTSRGRMSLCSRLGDEALSAAKG